jgi:hypothetical protein
LGIIISRRKDIMKKNIFVMAALAVLATACVKEQQPTAQAPADVDVEKTVLAVSVEPTKAVVDEGDGAVSRSEERR